MEGAECLLKIDAVSRAFSFATVPRSGSDVPNVLLLAVPPATVLAMASAPPVPEATDVVVSAAPVPGYSFAGVVWGDGALKSSASCRRFLGFTSPAVEVSSI